MTPSRMSTAAQVFTASVLVFFSWTTVDGVLAFGDPDRVPAKYKDAAVERTWEDLRASTDKRWTIDMSRSTE